LVSATLEAPAVKKIAPRGAMKDLLVDLRSYKGERKIVQVLIEGPRGSAKSLNFTRFLYLTADAFPGMRILVVRKTRADLAATWCQTFESEVLPANVRQQVVGDSSATHRTEYRLPNSSVFYLCGLDRPSKHQGANLDAVLIEEAEEVQWHQVQGFFGAIRQFTPGLPWQLFACLTNPGPPKHWANQKAISGLMRRVVTTHKDNPKWWDESAQEWTDEGRAYMASLSRYTGVQYKRHVLGEWAAAEGTVWSNFDESLHVIDTPRHEDNTPDYKALGIKDYIGSMDWGYTAPGCLSIYGRDGDKRLILVANVYRTKQQLEWWAERVSELDTEFGLTRIMCDPSRPDAIALVNDWLSKNKKPRLCEPADNKKASSPGGDLAGIDLVRWGFEKDEAGIPRIRFLRDALRYGIDADLHANNQPTQGYDEIGGYTFARGSDGEILDDRTDPDVPDHFGDCVRYLSAENWKRGAPKPDPIPKFDSGSMGQVYRHADEFKQKRRHRPVWGVR
jgi:phage terminase large subunit